MDALQREIDAHRAAVADLDRRVDGVLIAVESLTTEAREELANYQQLKHQAGESLAVAGERFHKARQAFRRADGLLGDLESIKAVHVTLSHTLQAALQDGDNQEAQRIVREFMAIRRGLRRTYKRIRQARKEARLAEPRKE